MSHNIINITDSSDARVAMFGALTDRELRRSREADNGLFIAESPKVIRVALDAGWKPKALLCERRHIDGDARDIIESMGEDVPVYSGDREVLASLTGYTLTRGVLCAMERRQAPTLADVLDGARRVAVIDGVSDTTNIGAIFRSAAALGMDAVLLTRTSCDPLNRRAVRVSMGSVFLVPWTWVDGDLTELHDYGFKTAALALTNRSVSIADPLLKAEPRLAMVLGTEGDGLDKDVIARADYTVKIPMYHDVDSLNVAAAAAVAFWELRADQ